MRGVRLDRVRKAYGSVTVIEQIDLAIEEGEFLVLLGPSGCGKSTLLNIIAGLEPLSGGSISIQGRDVTALEPDQRDIAMVFQSYALYPTLSVRKNIGFALKMRGTPAAEIERKVGQVAELLQITHLLDRKPGQLSGGQMQRVAIGRALVREPSVFLFDEPLSNLDAKLRADMRIELKKLHERLGRTIIYVTHDQIEAMTMATRIVVMNQGRIQQCDTPEAVYGRPANRFVASFVGAPTMNFIDGHLGQAGDIPAVITPAGIIPLPGLGAISGPPGRAVTLGFRPEHGVIADAADASTVTATPLMSEPTGPDLYVLMRLDPAGTGAGIGSEFTLRAPADAVITRHSPVPLRLDGRRVSLFDPENGARLN